jgi:tRNA A37 threonylcarbamoyladenosine synthetase subunit TsaC/SUA5/YrdC
LTVDGTVGVRWGAPSDASHLAAVFGAPLTATSANPSGTPPIATSEDIVATFAVPVAKGELFVVSGRAPGGAPSTVVVIRGEELWLAREGAIAKAALTAALPAGVKLQS